MKKVYCLYRVSTKSKMEKHDIPMQRIECEKFAQEKGWYIAKEYVENGVSGYSVSMESRDAIIMLKEAASKQEFDVLLVFMFDRLGRRKDETAFIVEWFVRQGIEVWSTREGEQRFDHDVDSLINYIRFWQAEGESKKIGERIYTRMSQLTEEGFYTGGTPAYGYRRVQKGRKNKKGIAVPDLEIHPEQAVLVKELYQKTASEGCGSYVLAKWCNEQSLQTTSGKLFQSTTVLRILRNRAYCGYILYGDCSSPHKPELQIIDEDLYNHVQYILEQRQSKNQEMRQLAFTTRGEALLSGNIFCGYCGLRMTSSVHRDHYVRKDGSVYENNQHRYICYHRNRKLNNCRGQMTYLAHRIEPVVVQATEELFRLFETIQGPDALKQYINRQICRRKMERDKLQIELNSLSEQHKALLNQIAISVTEQGAFDMDILRSALLQNKEKYSTILEQIKRLQVSIKDTSEIVKSAAFHYEQVSEWAANFASYSQAQKKMVICQLFCRIELFDGYEVNLILDWKFKLLFAKDISRLLLADGCGIE